MLKDKVEQLLEVFFKENKLLFLIESSISLDNKIKIVIDGDNGATLNNCIALSRHIEHQLDREEEDFALEVTTAGAAEPIVKVRQYNKNIGRTLKVKTKEGDKFEGVLQEVKPEYITISWKAREPKPVGKGKVTVEKKQEILVDNIEQQQK